MGDLLLWLGAVLAFAILAQRQRVLARRLARLRVRQLRLERALGLRRPATGNHVTVINPHRFSPPQLAGFADRAQRMRSGG